LRARSALVAAVGIARATDRRGALLLCSALVINTAAIEASLGVTRGVLHVTIGVETVPEAVGAQGVPVAAVLGALVGVASR